MQADRWLSKKDFSNSQGLKKKERAVEQLNNKNN
jgi:hypothetical protein